jgi:oxygen-independent coproporphyrinogen-3 oxidase
MAGIYLHIPFCKQACYYCNFHFSTSLRLKDEMLAAILKEISLSQKYLENEKIETIYFGGGTPSILEATDIQHIIDELSRFYSIEANAEITIEANPDDLTDDKISAFRQTDINRFSIGIQSFFDDDLHYMNRAHNANEALTCVKKVQDAGFQNLTIDLIYGTPTMDNEQWEKNIDIALSLNVPHLSCYCLTIEPKTALESLVKKGKALTVDDEQAIWQFETLIHQMENAGFDHYEISNFGKPDFYARHNSNYWLGAKYLGLGPSAHSFDGRNRRYNIANNALYIKSLEDGKIPFEEEVLSQEQRYNEYVMISLRTIWGTDLEKIKSFGESYFNYFSKKINEFMEKDFVYQQSNIFRLTKKGKLMADFIAMELFFEK